MTTLAGFKGGYQAYFKRLPTDQEIFDAGVAEGMRREAERASDASRAPAASVIFPPMPLPLIVHPKIGNLYDRTAMHLYAVKFADLCVAHSQLAVPQPAKPDPCPQCLPGAVCKTSTCGRLAEHTHTGKPA